MEEFLRLFDLSQYANVFQDMGYDSLSHLFLMTHKELTDLRQFTRMKPGHFARLLAGIEQVNVTATPNEASHPRGSMSQNFFKFPHQSLPQMWPNLDQFQLAQFQLAQQKSWRREMVWPKVAQTRLMMGHYCRFMTTGKRPA